MKPSSKADATVILFMIFVLMVSLLLMNTGYMMNHPGTYAGAFPVSNFLTGFFQGQSAESIEMLETSNWWIHIVLVLVFLNILPYSKHFHVIMARSKCIFLKTYSKGYIG